MKLPRKSDPKTLILRAARRAGQETAVEGQLEEAARAYEGEKSYLEDRRQSLEIDEIEERVTNSKQDRALRRKYADRAFTFLYFFAGFSAVILVAQGLTCVPISKTSCVKFGLPENVLVTLIGATAASVIGLVGWVARGLFKAPEK